MIPADESTPPRSRRSIGVAIALGVSVAAAGGVAALWFNSSDGFEIRNASYVGDLSCIACHQIQVEHFHHTAHARTSSQATADTVHGRLEAGANILTTANPNLHFRMESSPTGFTQTAVLKTSAQEVMSRTEPMDLVIGSGRKGQTYLFWEDDALFQLPVSFWTEHHTWVNSPGYVDGTANFERPIQRRCLECHASAFAWSGPPENKFKKDSLVLGISCEKCHGPGSEHVQRYRSAAPPRSLADAAIVNPAKLTRERQIDLCELCHAGAGFSKTPPLSYVPGDTLSDHLIFPRQASDAHIDVHASQVQLLERSRCFQASPAMTCTTCHDVHQPERDLASLASRCLLCHQVEHCGTFPRHGLKIVNQCVTCHMPLEQTDQIVIADPLDRTMQPKVRSHRIAIYPDVRLP